MIPISSANIEEVCLHSVEAMMVSKEGIIPQNVKFRSFNVKISETKSSDIKHMIVGVRGQVS
jgi:hypothetical protein